MTDTLKIRMILLIEVARLYFQEVVTVKEFHVTGTCNPKRHYMVDVSGRIEKITEEYIEKGKYFTINRARQYGKTTLMFLLRKYLQERYLVVSISFEAADELFVSPYALAAGLQRGIGRQLRMQKISEDIIIKWAKPISKDFAFDDFGERITGLCLQCDRKIILMIDEVDKNSDNQVFLGFLGLLRTKYLAQAGDMDTTFQSVILAGVYDIKNLKLKLRPDEESKYNSPWNIAEDFHMDLSFNPKEIAGMLMEYEADYSTGMDISAVSQWIYDYTGGYPYMVSRLCKLIDERIAKTADFPEKKDAWTREGRLEALRLFLKESNTLFDDMVKKLYDYPEIKDMLYDILFRGVRYSFEIDNPNINVGVMFGFVKEEENAVMIANRLFETKMYNLFLSEAELEGRKIDNSVTESNRFVVHGMLQMPLVMGKFYEYFEEIFKNSDEKFIEDEGRRIFLMYLRPIINGSGNYYIEAQTRDRSRTDVIVDYKSQRFIIEMKLWRGNAYNERGEKQLFEYLDFYKEATGYLLSFNFNKKKQTGIKEILLNGKKIVEIVV